MDEQQLRAMMQEHHTASFGWARVCATRLGGEAEDVLQTVYMKILNGQARYDGRSAFKTWLFSVIRNTALDERRRRRLHGWFFSGTAAEDRPTPAVDQLAQLERSEAAESFREALAGLSDRQQETLHLVFYQDLSIQEAAAVMGVSIGSARTHYERGKQRLREWLREREERDARR